jgi:hypothetical protein
VAASEEQGATQKSKKSRSSDAGSATREAAGSSSENSPASLSAAAGHDQSPSSPASAEQDDPCSTMPRLVTPQHLASKQTAMLLGVKARATKSQPAQAPSASSSPPDEGSPPSDSPSGGELDESFRAAVGAIKAQILKTSARGAHLRGGQPPRPPLSRESMILEGARSKTRKKSGKTSRGKTV